MTTLTQADEISHIAFGFMGSKALFAALHFKVFTHLSEGPLDAEGLAKRAGLHRDRAETLLTALAGLGLVTVENGQFSNSPAAEAFLVKGAKYDFGDYLRLQVGRQMYGLLDQIEGALDGSLGEDDTKSYAEWFADPEEARLYSESQHSGSLGPARQLARSLDLSGARHLLDVGGGTGAFAITLCEANPDLQATIVEFPNVAALGRDYVEKAGLSDRITYAPGNALEADWPGKQDVVLMSYLFSGVPGEAHKGLVDKAVQALRPGGRILIHDFVVDEDRSGPVLAALWQLQHTAFTPKARSLDAEWLHGALARAGFDDVTVEPMIPEMTMLAQGVKPT
ncbi:acetylserotonin O-methyltransferase [Lutimaribacter sp. EGI FJ00015]|uniref:Acetylserotonin O-methyltransferase n=1 Tax=Lutimaribacter degradans TaxID=2945989 RepID=A0ACC5ZV99_9RHOB|nr:acetylserotonin O-methyltransferase [Lutimaribacter sp. EGI FJ00013]MCM2562217.1 acetylserotonin O-methyltransferase [Lutimaribacter sp. EGI FJ00013]MCO0613372.1 acetylserotonin O-methyltransferase [Lutimaribacter sp. EGI FJ00015]MCO0636346.1 acetylserotonin O-methyltransferase [Lutimaribacter sp. EGI FJ00014]